MISKVIGVILAFAMLVIAPLVITQMTQDMAMKRLVLNEVTSFIDKVTDKSAVSPEDVDDIRLGVNSRGGAFDIKLVRYVRISVPDSSRPEGIKSLYVATEDVFGNATVELKQGDVIQVRVTALTPTQAQKSLQGFLKVIERDFDFTMAGMAR
jgi:hypothetical protein